MESNCLRTLRGNGIYDKKVICSIKDKILLVLSFCDCEASHEQMSWLITGICKVSTLGHVVVAS